MAHSQKPWTEEDKKFLRRNYRKKKRSWIARQLGRTPQQISDAAARIIRRKSYTSAQKKKRLKQLCGGEIRKNVQTGGKRGGGNNRAAGYQKFAVECGWPDDLRLREVQILNVLADKGIPMTIPEIAKAIGSRTDKVIKGRGYLILLAACSNRGGSYMGRLIKRGLLSVINTGGKKDGTRGKARNLYVLGPEALKMLERRAHEQAAKIQSRRRKKSDAAAGPD